MPAINKEGLIVRICIDPGHSGPMEPGACAGGVTEAAIVLAIAKMTAKILTDRGTRCS